VLVGGATGVGKSTVAEGLARTLDVPRIVTTDLVREILRDALPSHVEPALHVSSFEAGDTPAVRDADPVDPVVAGFLEQARVVLGGVRSLLRRARVEEVDIIVEGVHLVPGAVEHLVDPASEAAVVPLVIVVDDEERHRSYLLARSQDTARRPPARYLNRFPEIRRIQAEVIRRAEEHGVRMVRSTDPETTVAEALGVVDKTLAQIA
jgi:2-phosphoglycerate kinase